MMKKRTKEMLIVLALIGIILVLTIAETNMQKLGSNMLPSTSILIFGLLNLNVVLLILIIFLVTRNVVKLWLERKRGILGAKIRTKLVAAFVTLTIIPTAVLFFASIIFLNRSMESWLSKEVEQFISHSMDVANVYYSEATEDALHYAHFISHEITERRLLKEGNLEILRALLDQNMSLFRLSAIEVLSAQGEELVRLVSPEIGVISLPSTESSIVRKAMAGESIPIVLHTGQADIIGGVVPIKSSFNPKDTVGVLIVNYYVPQSLSQRLSMIRSSFADYVEARRLKGLIKIGYMIVLTSITLLVIFSAIWYGINLSKGLTTPIEKLVEGTQRVSNGDLGFTIEAQSNDELGILVKDFNAMVEDLRNSRSSLEKAYNELAYRSRYIQTVVNKISAGVISINKDDKISMINPSAQKMLSIPIEKVLGRPFMDVIKTEHMPLIKGLLDELKSSPKGTPVEKQIVLNVGEDRLTLMVHASLLYDDSNEYMGMVVVFDDLTQIQKMQRMSAWREVARRIAHEVKNPLTPIQLSAQRLRRKYIEKMGDDREVFDECTGVIIHQVDEMRKLVDEFSAFAKMPASAPVPDDLNDLVVNAVALYRQAHSDIEYIVTTDSNIPLVNIDSSQMGRALANLLENATDAVKENNSPDKKIIVETSYNELLHIATLEIKDTGIGISKRAKERLFEPYFSTKRGGTGLGLAIVNRIVADHEGFIRVRDNIPNGTVFSIELPVKG